MSQSLEERSRKRYLRWQNDWAEGLASCYHCGKEYTDAETIVVNDEESCPHCKNIERKIYYYCKEHGSREDDCER